MDAKPAKIRRKKTRSPGVKPAAMTVSMMVSTPGIDPSTIGPRRILASIAADEEAPGERSRRGGTGFAGRREGGRTGRHPCARRIESAGAPEAHPTREAELMSDRVKIPIVETYRGVGIHDFQPANRIERVVKPAIDAVYGLSDPVDLAAYAAISAHPPEARLFAVARCEAAWEMAAENRESRPKVDMQLVRASAPSLDSLGWICSSRYTSLLDPCRDALPRDAANGKRAHEASEATKPWNQR